MSSKRICPFYGKSIEQCDVGYGYISPYHVEVMVRHCLSNYEACGKYRALTCREREGRVADAGFCGADDPSGGSPFPLQLDREVITAVQHAIRTPLTSICSFSEILLNYPIDDTDAQRHFLQIIYDEAKRLSQNLSVIFGKTDPDTEADLQLANGSADN